MTKTETTAIPQASIDEYIPIELRAKEEHRSIGSLHQENHRGDGPPRYRFGKRVLYLRSEVEAWRRSRVVSA